MNESPYTEYINEVFAAIKCLLPVGKNPEVAFGEGNVSSTFSGRDRDYAIIRNENAVMFVNLIQEYSNLFLIDQETIALQSSRIDKNEVKYRHSCYPRNIHRWLSGTISRKKLCRIEFVGIAYCWAIGWRETVRPATDEAVSKRLKAISRRYCNDISESDHLLVCLWRACEHAYRHSVK